MPRLKPHQVAKHFEAAEQKVGQDKPRHQKSTGPAKQSLEPAQIEPVDRPIDKKWADAMAFNETMIDITVHETTDSKAAPIPDIYVNGIPQRFIRGQTQSVKWKFVEVLARAKETRYTQEKYTDGEGNESYRNVPHTALKYPFSLVNASQKYQDRLKAVLAEA